MKTTNFLFINDLRDNAHAAKLSLVTRLVHRSNPPSSDQPTINTSDLHEAFLI